jgi:hypothetical protein
MITAFCEIEIAACGLSGTSTNGQYTSSTQCNSKAALFPTTGMFGDTTYNTLQCRAYHAGVALAGDAAAKILHCPHTGTASSTCAGDYPGTGSSSASAVAAVSVAAFVVAAVAFAL